MESVFTYITVSSGAEMLMVFGAVFIVTYVLFRQRDVSDGGRKVPPALSSLPIVGSLPFIPLKPEDLAEFCISPKNNLGKIFSFRLGSK